MNIRRFNSIILPLALFACASSRSKSSDAGAGDLASPADLAGSDGFSPPPSGLQLRENYCPKSLANTRCYYDSASPPDGGNFY